MKAIGFKRACGRPRAAFTLVELMIVISIIALLMTISAAVYWRVTAAQQNAAASRNVTKVQNALWQFYGIVKKQAEDEAKSPNLRVNPAYTTISALAGGDPNITQVLWVKYRLRQSFPMSFGEAYDRSVFPSLFATQLQNAGIPYVPITTPPAPHESAACLYLALQRNPSGGIQSEELMKNATGQVGNPAITGFVDSWGNPLAFCRWPTGYFALNPSGASSGWNDPEDNFGALASTLWLSTSGAQYFMTPYSTYAGHALPTSGLPASYLLRPIVISAGPDGILGLNYYTLAPDSNYPGAANDNIAINPTP